MAVAEMQRGVQYRNRGKSRSSLAVMMLLRIIWISGLLSATLAALLSTQLFPAFHSVFKVRNPPFTDLYKFQRQHFFKKEELGVQIVDKSDKEAREYALQLVDESKETREFEVKLVDGSEETRRAEMHNNSESNAPSNAYLPRIQPGISSILQQLSDADAWLENSKLWNHPPSRGFKPCVKPSESYEGPVESQGYLLVHTNGGLNQMRAGICDMVAVARIINATLVIPELDKRSFWHDSSNFSDVFDEDYFINALANDVKVIKKLPKDLASATRAVKHFRSWSGVEYYRDEIASLWQEYKIIRAAKSDSRLANNNLPPDIQKLRCRVHYDALRFAPHIEAMGKLLVERMRSYGNYIALHLRYEKDMLAFSGCTYGLTPSEADELTTIRENTPYWKVKEINSTEQRNKGFCPLTPKEVRIFLRALGYPPSTPIYIASGEIYGGNRSMAELQSLFPNLLRKETLEPESLIPFMPHATQMAALDYIVSVESDVFVPTYSGNMARAVEGHRRYLGHRKTIIPDRKALVSLFNKIDRGQLRQAKRLSAIITEIHKRRQGSPRKRKGPLPGTKGRERFRTEEAFYTNPLPDCMCQNDTDSLVES